MSKSGEITKRAENPTGEKALSRAIVQLPSYESGGLSTDHLTAHLATMFERWEQMDGELFTRAIGTARAATKYWDTVRGLERLSIEREKLALKAGPGTTAKVA